MKYSIPHITAQLLKADESILRDLVGGLRELGMEKPALVRAQQLAQIEGITAFVRTHPFWSKRLPVLPSPLTWTSFESIPILTKSELAAEGLALEMSQVPPAFSPTSSVTTSGSTGTPVTTRSSFATSLLARALQLRLLRSHEFDFSSTTLFLQAPKSEGVRRSLEEGPSWAHPFGLGKSLHFDLRASEDEQLAALREARPSCLVTYPSNLNRLLVRLEETQTKLEGLRHIGLSSEPVSDELMARATSLTGARVLRTYSASEVGLIGYESPNSSEIRVASENVYVEIVREDGSPAPPGELGRVIVTTLHDLLRPLLRYDIGDYAAIDEGADGHPCFTKIAGRERSMIRLQDGRRVWPYFRFELLGERRPFSSWQLRQQRDLSLVVSIIPRPEYEPSQASAIEEVVREALPGLPILVRVVSELSRAKNGKFLEVLSEADADLAPIAEEKTPPPPRDHGTNVHLHSPRVSLLTLTESDLAPYGEDETPEWFGSPERRKHVWMPNLKPLEYLRGLIRATDGKRTFSFLIHADGTPVGFIKAHTATATDGLMLVATTVIGDERYAGRGLGTEAAKVLNWFSIERLGVTTHERRVYEDNEHVRRLLETAGYVASAAAEEPQLDGKVRRYFVYKITSKDWLERNLSATESFRISPAESARKNS